MKNKLMRSLSVCAAMVFLILSFAACGSQKSTQSSDKVVNIFTWANYVPDSVVKQFEKQTGIKVNYSNFSTNEEMLAKLQATKGDTWSCPVQWAASAPAVWAGDTLWCPAR